MVEKEEKEDVRKMVSIKNVHKLKDSKSSSIQTDKDNITQSLLLLVKNLLNLSKYPVGGCWNATKGEPIKKQAGLVRPEQKKQVVLEVISPK